MEGLTWRALTSPEYAMTFVEGFLLPFVTALGLGNVAEGSGMIELARLPSLQMFLGACALGLMGGIRSLRNLRSPAPLPRQPRDGQEVKP